MWGKSTGNQRIEAWWSILRRQCTEFWISRFKRIQSTGLLNVDDPAHIQCLRFCFVSLLQRDLQRTVVEWNTHRINVRRNEGLVAGKPDKMYFLPTEFHVEDCGCEYMEEDVKRIRDEMQEATANLEMVSPQFVQLVRVLMPNWRKPKDFESALELFCLLLTKIRNQS